MKGSRFTPSMVVALAALVIAAAGGAYAAGTSSSPTINACVSHKGGTLYVATKCAHGDKRIKWGVTGPQGAPGAAGNTGATGPAGPSTGAAGGDLSGSYPNPSIAAGAVTNSKLANPALSITAGIGLSGGGSVSLGGTGSLSVDQTVVQQRVTGTCSSGNAVASVNQDGTVGCQSPTPIVYASSSGMPITLSTLGPSLPGTIAELPLDGDDGASASGVGSATSIDTTSTSPNVPQTFPAAQTITGMTIYVSVSVASAPANPLAIVAQLYTATGLSNTFVPVAGAAVTAAPVLGTSLPVGTSADGSISGLSIPISSGTRGMVVVRATEVAPPASSVSLYISTSLTAR